MDEREYRVPYESAYAEIVEKKSRFISNIRPVETEVQAREMLCEIRKTYHDASHHCFAYLIREGGIARYSDDGEPQGTAGMPILGVLQREDVTNVCCVVTRYFGGVLLGAGGLTRAYAKAAGTGLDSAGVAVMRPWRRVLINTDYKYLEQLRLILSRCLGVEEDTQYAADITVSVLLPKEGVQDFETQVGELTAGQAVLTLRQEMFRGQKIASSPQNC